MMTRAVKIGHIIEMMVMGGTDRISVTLLVSQVVIFPLKLL